MSSIYSEKEVSKYRTLGHPLGDSSPLGAPLFGQCCGRLRGGASDAPRPPASCLCRTALLFYSFSTL
ncbi:hypothetical protein J6590_007214 [Homalodisca vitripennis]|nr:hypothetical protein J6590_007214 [Homalodisca vitripennis]